MGLVTTLNAVKDYLEANFPILSHGNTSVQSESIFNVLLTNEDCGGKGAIVEFAGTYARDAQQSEFGGTLLRWRISITLFGVLYGDDEQESTQIISVYNLIDDIVDDIKTKSTLSGTVMDIAFDRIETPVLYERQQINNYLMLSIIFMVTENL